MTTHRLHPRKPHRGLNNAELITAADSIFERLTAVVDSEAMIDVVDLAANALGIDVDEPSPAYDRVEYNVRQVIIRHWLDTLSIPGGMPPA